MHLLVSRVQTRERGERPIGRAVVDEDDLPRLSEWLKRRRELVVQECDAALLVVHRDDHRDHGR